MTAIAANGIIDTSALCGLLAGYIHHCPRFELP
jgi:hypothetical protein